MKAPHNRYLAFLAGVALLEAVSLIPVVGWLVGFAAAVFGFGLIGAAIGAAREGSGLASKPGQLSTGSRG